MTKLLLEIFRRYGSEISAFDGKGWTVFHGFLQAVTERGSSHYQKEVSPVGQIPLGTYVYIGPATIPVQEGGLLKKDGQEYRLCRVEAMSGAKGPVYNWGLCVKKGGEDTWGQS